MNHRLPALSGPLVLLICLLAACSARTDVSLTGNTPAQYSHVWLTTQELWFNNSATAGPDDGGWAKFPLSTPTTIDLVAVNNGNLSNIVTGLNVVPGTYSQLRIIPVDATAALTSSAQSAGALYNSEADFVDSGGNTHQLPLELLNPDKGVGIGTSLKVPVGNVGAALAGANSSSAATTGTVGTGIGNNTGTTIDPTTGLPIAAPGTTGSTTTGTITGLGVGTTGTGTGTATGTTAATQTPNSFAVFLDGTSDLLPFNYPGNIGIMLSPHPAAYDLSQVAGISGKLTLTNLTSATSGLPAIQVSAQVLSADGTRHVIVSSTPVQSDGSFLLYPLAANSSNTTYYEVVIHGPGIATIIVKSVQLLLPGSSSSTTLTPSTTNGTTGTTTGTTTLGTTGTTTGTTTTGTTTTNTTGGTTTNGTTSGSGSGINTVSLGTLTPRSADNYTANLATSPAATLPAGALIGFYQTLQGSGEVPYLIEESPIDPFNEVLFTAQELSTGTVDSGTWSASSTSVTVVSAAPAQGAGNYSVAASAPGYSAGALTPEVKAPASGTGPITVSVAKLSLPSGTAAGSLHATVTQTTPGRFDSGELLVSQNGMLVGSAPLAGFAQGPAAGVVNGLPAETATALYYVTLRVWSSSAPTAVVRQWYPQAVDLRSSTSDSISLSVAD